MDTTLGRRWLQRAIFAAVTLPSLLSAFAVRSYCALRASWRDILKQSLLLGILTAIAGFWGLAVVVMEFNALILVFSLLACIFILYDFRAGVALLIVLMPISASRLFPHELLGITGLNPVNILFF